MLDSRELEAINETIFRGMNERTEEANDVRLGLGRTMDTYLCECSAAQCTAPIDMTRREYEAVRAVPIRFAIAVNHENPEVDNVFLETPRYAVVEKFYRPDARIARATDPRR